jgi:4-hydroxy-3-polyprenylbenzoate decarboxylase
MVTRKASRHRQCRLFRGDTGLAFGLDPTLSGMNMIKAWKEKLGSYKPLKPVDVANGPITEHVDAGDHVDMLKFPTPRWHETTAVVISAQAAW